MVVSILAQKQTFFLHIQVGGREQEADKLIALLLPLGNEIFHYARFTRPCVTIYDTGGFFRLPQCIEFLHIIIDFDSLTLARNLRLNIGTDGITPVLDLLNPLGKPRHRVKI
ncbi:Uncharacterised protein [uncultured Blautia sp.]|nr:Uncharacterised protein [uncultured Blautia sp.]